MFDSLSQNQEKPMQEVKPQIDTVVPPQQQSVSPQAPTVQQAQAMGTQAASVQPSQSNEAATGTLGQAMGQGQVYTMPEKYMPSSSSSGKKGSGGGNKRFFLIIAIVFAVFVIVLAAAVFFLQPYLQQNSSTPFELPTNGNQAGTNTDEETNENTNTTTDEETNENTNTGLSLNFNVNEDLEENINDSLFDDDSSNSNTNTGSSDVSGAFLDRSGVSTARDKDKDKLTDEEEDLYGTEFNRPDSDGDGYVDGTELVNLYAPDEADAELLESDAVSLYENDEYGWSIYYPTSWFEDQIDSQTNQVYFTSDTVDGELIEVNVLENTEDQTAAEWFASLYDDIDAEDLEEVQLSGAQGIMSPDGFTYYVAKGDYIYGINYSFGTKDKITFQTTFEMMVNSFTITEVKEPADSNTTNTTNTNTNTDTSANTNSDSAVNTNSSINSNSNTNTTDTNANTNAA